MVYLSAGGPGIFPGGLVELLRRSAAARGSAFTIAAAFLLKLYWEQLSGPLMDTRLMEALTGHGWLTRLLFRMPVALPFFALLLLIYIWAPKLRLRLIQIDHTPLDPDAAIGSELKPLIYPWFATVLIWAALDLTGHALIDRWSWLAPHPITGFFDEPYFRVHLFLLLAKYACWYFGGAMLAVWIALLNRGGSLLALLGGYLPAIAIWQWLEFLAVHTVTALPNQVKAQLSLLNYQFDWSEALQLLAFLSLSFAALMNGLVLAETSRRRASLTGLKRLITPWLQSVLVLLPPLLLGAGYQALVLTQSSSLPVGGIVRLENSRIGMVVRPGGRLSREVPPLGPGSGGNEGFSSLNFNRYNVLHQIARYSADGRQISKGSYPVDDTLYSGWFTPGGWYVWIKHVNPLSGGSIPWLYAIDPQDKLHTYDLSGVAGNALPMMLFGLNYPLIARADETGGWVIACDGRLGTFDLLIAGEPSSAIMPPDGFLELLNSGRFRRRLTDFGLAANPQARRERASRVKYGADGELYAIDRNGCLWRISKNGKLVRLSGGVLHRLLGNAPTGPVEVPAYGPWEGSRAAFAFNSRGEGRQFDPYNGIVYLLDPESGLEPLYRLPVVIDKKKWTDSPYKAPGRLLLGGERHPAQWDLWDSPSSTLDDGGNFYVYLDRLLLFPPEAQ